MKFRPALAALTCVLFAACQTPSKDAEEAARNTYACNLDGERLVVRFDGDEVRLLMPGGDRVILYQIQSTPPMVRFTNGRMELRGRGTSLDLVRDGAATALVGCQQFAPPKG
jgi:hypothetical protein